MRGNTAILAVALLVAAPPLAAAELDRFQPDLTRYFADPSQEVMAREKLEQRTRAFISAPSWGAKDAAKRLGEGAALLSDWMRHATYCRAQSARDTGDREAKTCQSEADDRYESLKSFVDVRLGAPLFAKMSEGDLARFGLLSYRDLIAQAGDAARHSLPPAGQQAAAALADPMLQGLYDRYDATVRSLSAQALASSRGPLDPIKDAARIALDPDPALRRDGATALSAAYGAHEELFAATLIDVVREETALARLHGYDDAPDWIYARRLGLGEGAVRDLLERISRRGGVLKDYQAVRARRVASVTGLAAVHSWDMTLSSGFSPTILDIDTARGLILKALAPLGPDYVGRFGWLLDPANGAIDLAGGASRYRGGFSQGFPGVPVMLYVGGYDGSFAKMSVIIHEGGHALHRKFMDSVSPYAASAPKYLAEGIAIFNELLLLDEMERDSRTPEESVYYQEKFLDKLAHEIFTAAEEGSLEQGLYDGVASGALTDAAGIDALNGEILDRYELFAAGEPTLRGGWMRKGLLYEDPLYLVNYLYAGLLACRFHAMSEADPEGFRTRYLALMHEGFEAPGDDALRRIMGFGLDAESLLDDALALMGARTRKLDAAYQALSSSSPGP